jgi:signal transduction histidine kinase
MNVWEALAVAALEVERDAHQVREDVGSPGEVARLASAVVADVRSEAGQSAAGGVDLSRSSLPRRVLGMLRARFLSQMSAMDPVPAVEDVLPVLLAMERVSERLQPLWNERFSDRLSGPDGLELVVEVAHDLRSPMTSILFLAETLLRGRSGPVTPLQERQLGLIYSAAFGLSSVASDMVELVRERDRLADLEPLPFSITDIFDAVRDIVRPIAEEKGLEVRLTLPEQPFRIGHPVALNRVLLNLTTNALKFTDEGYVELAAVAGPGDAVEFSVHDTGRGIPPRALELLFEPFRRRQRDQEYAFSGSGLGLSICRKFVEAMGSELRVETREGKGTRFSFVLRLHQSALGETASYGVAAVA